MDMFTGIIRDISERKRLDEREREHQAELAHVLRVATAGELASGLAHELNQPLAAISNNIQACVSRIRAGEGGGKNLLRLLKHGTGEALRAGSIVHSLRDMVEKRPARSEPIDLCLPIRRVHTLLIGEIKRHHMDARLVGIENPVPVTADAVQIEQVLINLMQNAIESIDKARGKTRQLVIRLSRAGTRMAEVAVRDSGTGVSEAAAKRLFTPFFSTRPQGLGLGLALSRTIIEAHGGRLRYTPRRGRGATFRFTLPLCVEKAAHKRRPGAAPRAHR